MGGASANYFRFCMRDVTHDITTQRDVIGCNNNKINIMLMKLQEAAILCRFLQVFATFSARAACILSAL